MVEKTCGSISSNKRRYEKDDNLKLALKVKRYLNDEDVIVIMTRSKDKFVSLENRCKIANFFKADLFVSLHRNSAKDGDGVEIWVQNEASDDELELANNILDKLDKTEIQSNRGIKNGTSDNMDNDYYVNKYTNMSSCIVEMGFISNYKDNELFDRNLEKYAKSIADGILETLNE